MFLIASNGAMTLTPAGIVTIKGNSVATSAIDFGTGYVRPQSNNAVALGTVSNGWSDIFMASGADLHYGGLTYNKPDYVFEIAYTGCAFKIGRAHV